MLPDMVGKAIVVLFLVGGEVEWGCGALAEQEVDHGGIVETTMEIGAMQWLSAMQPSGVPSAFMVKGLYVSSSIGVEMP